MSARSRSTPISVRLSAASAPLTKRTTRSSCLGRASRSVRRTRPDRRGRGGDDEGGHGAPDRDGIRAELGRHGQVLRPLDTSRRPQRSSMAGRGPTVCFHSCAHCGPQRWSQPGSTFLTRMSRPLARRRRRSRGPRPCGPCVRPRTPLRRRCRRCLRRSRFADSAQIACSSFGSSARSSVLQVGGQRIPRRAVGDEGGDAPVDRHGVDVARDLVQADRVARHRAGDRAVDVAAAHVRDDLGEGGLHRHGAERRDPVRLRRAGDPDPAPAPGRRGRRSAWCRR